MGTGAEDLKGKEGKGEGGGLRGAPKHGELRRPKREGESPFDTLGSPKKGGEDIQRVVGKGRQDGDAHSCRGPTV